MYYSPKKIKEIIVAVCLIYTFCFLVFGFKLHYGPDTYLAIMNPTAYAEHAMQNGRPVHVIVFYILNSIGKYSLRGAYGVSLFSSILFVLLAEIRFAFFLYIDYLARNDEVISTGNTILIALLSCISICNLFSVEYFIYPEVGPMWIMPIWLCVEATIQFIGYTDDGKWKHIWISFLCLLISAFAYQIICGVFFILATLFILLRAGSLRKYIQQQILAGIIYAIAIIINMIFGSLLVNNVRLNTPQSGVIESANKYKPAGTSTQQFILDRITFGMVVYIIACVLIAVVFVIFALRHDSKIDILKGVYIASVIILVGTLPFVSKMSNDYHPRLYYPIGFLPGLLMVYALYRGWLGRYLIRAVSEGIIALLIVTNIVSSMHIHNDCYLTTYNDEIMSHMYDLYINKYVDSTGNKVDKIVFYQDQNRTKYMGAGWCLSMRVYGVTWARLEALNFWNDSDYLNGTPNEEIESFFAENDWDSFDPDQIILEDDTAHICCY